MRLTSRAIDDIWRRCQHRFVDPVVIVIVIVIAIAIVIVIVIVIVMWQVDDFFGGRLFGP